MPGHISKTVLSAGGCHSALEAHANICQATTQRMKVMPSRPLCPPISLSLFFSVSLVSECIYLDLSILHPCTNASVTIMTSHCTIWSHFQCVLPCTYLSIIPLFYVCLL